MPERARQRFERRHREQNESFARLVRKAA
jgi:hypothetical protein